MSKSILKCEKCDSKNVSLSINTTTLGELLGLLCGLKHLESSKTPGGQVRVTCKDCGHTTILNIL